MNKPIRALVGIVSILFVLPFAVYLVWLTGNLKDDEWSPAATELMSADREAIDSPQGNAYHAFIGIEAPEKMAPATWGEGWVARAKSINSGMLAPEEWVGSGRRKRTVTDTQPLPCREAPGCLARVAAETQAVERVLADERIILERLDALTHLPFQEVGLGSVSLTSPVAPYPGWAFILAQHRFALRVSKDQHPQALQHWARETAFLARIMEGSESTVTYLAAASTLRRYHHLMAEYLSLYPEAARVHEIQIQTAVAQLPTQALSLNRVLTHEAQSTLSTVMNVGKSGAEGLFFKINNADGFSVSSSAKKVLNELSAPFFKPIATGNRVAGWFEAWVEADSRHHADYQEQLLKLRSAHRGKNSNWAWLGYRNPVGKVLEGVLFQDGYVAGIFFRRDDIVADRLLLQHALAVTTGRVAFNPLPAVLYQADLVHPFTGRVPIWDSAHRELRFELPEDLKLPHRYASLAVRFTAAP